MGEARDPLPGAADERSRAFDIAERPQRKREVVHRRDAGVLSEAEGQIVVAAWLEQGQRALQMIARFTILSGEPTRRPCYTVRDTGFGRIGSRLDVAQECRRVLPHRGQLAPNQAADPQAVVGRQPFRRVLVACRRLAGSGERFRRFRRPVAARGDERVAVGDVQLRQSLPMRGVHFDLVGRRECSQQRLRLGDLGHFRRRRKAFERRREDGVGFGEAAGRLIEFGQRQRRAQFEAARTLLVRRPRLRSGGRLLRTRGRRGRASAGFRRGPDAVPLRTRDSQCGRRSPALRRGWRPRGRDRPPELPSRPAQSSIARRTTERSVRAAARRRGACPRARRRPRRLRRTPNPRETRRTRDTGSDRCSRARRASSTAFGATRARSPRISSNMAACILPGASVPTWVRSAIRASARRTRETARSTSPSGHNVSAR